MAMNKWVKRKWVRALRSGEYVQGQMDLICLNGTACCLGVLVAECYPDALIEDGCPTGVEVGRAKVKGAGWIVDDLLVMWDLDEKIQRHLGRLNDEGNKFPAIADWIEENL